MTDQLVEQIRRHSDAEPIPELDLAGVIGRGRRLRRRRSVVRRTIAVAAVAAVAGTAIVTGQQQEANEIQLEVSTGIAASDVALVSTAYRTGGAFSRGDTLWFSDPDYDVDLGVTIQLMYYTADGVVAGVTNDEAGDAKRDYVYVGTDGSARALNLPGKVVPGTDALADRLAYLTKEGSGYRIHVVEASTGSELATHTFDAPYSWAGWDVPPIGLTGEYVVIGVDGNQQVLNWRTGELAADLPGAQLPSAGGGRALGGELGAEVYQLGDSDPLRSTEDLAVADESGYRWAINELSPDGRYVRTTNTTIGVDDDGHVTKVYSGVGGKVIRNPVVHVTDVATGRRITLPGHARTYGWTPDGRLMRVNGSKVTTCDGSTGDCTTRTVPDGPGTIRMAGGYLGS